MAHVEGHGWCVEAHRFRVGHSDLDLVVRREGLVAFVEVKTRTSDGYGSPAESVGWRKRRTIARLAAVWRERHGRSGDEYRFDVMEVRVGPGGGVALAWLEDAWRLTEQDGGNSV